MHVLGDSFGKAKGIVQPSPSKKKGSVQIRSGSFLVSGLNAREINRHGAKRATSLHRRAE